MCKRTDRGNDDRAILSKSPGHWISISFSPQVLPMPFRLNASIDRNALKAAYRSTGNISVSPFLPRIRLTACMLICLAEVTGARAFATSMATCSTCRAEEQSEWGAARTKQCRR